MQVETNMRRSLKQGAIAGLALAIRAVPAQAQRMSGTPGSPGGENLDIGADTATGVAHANPQPPFAFTGTLETVTLALDHPVLTDTDRKHLREVSASKDRHPARAGTLGHGMLGRTG